MSRKSERFKRVKEQRRKWREYKEATARRRAGFVVHTSEVRPRSTSFLMASVFGPPKRKKVK